MGKVLELLPSASARTFDIVYRNVKCAHAQTEIDAKNRELTCKVCGASVDPFDVLLAIAYDQNQDNYKKEYLAKEAARLEERVKELERQINNLRAQKNRLIKSSNE